MILCGRKKSTSFYKQEKRIVTKKKSDSNNSKNAGYSTLLLVKCLQVAERFEHYGAL